MNFWKFTEIIVVKGNLTHIVLLYPNKLCKVILILDSGKRKRGCQIENPSLIRVNSKITSSLVTIVIRNFFFLLLLDIKLVTVSNR